MPKINWTWIRKCSHTYSALGVSFYSGYGFCDWHHNDKAGVIEDVILLTICLAVSFLTFPHPARDLDEDLSDS